MNKFAAIVHHALTRHVVDFKFWSRKQPKRMVAADVQAKRNKAKRYRRKIS